MLEKTLAWGHMAPSAPDTLACYPYHDRDPFQLDGATPHVYFAGNQPAFGTRLVRGAGGQQTRLVLVPAFAETGTLVLVNADTLDCHTITFDTAIRK